MILLLYNIKEIYLNSKRIVLSTMSLFLIFTSVSQFNEWKWFSMKHSARFLFSSCCCCCCKGKTQSQSHLNWRQKIVENSLWLTFSGFSIFAVFFLFIPWNELSSQTKTFTRMNSCLAKIQSSFRIAQTIHGSFQSVHRYTHTHMNSHKQYEIICVCVCAKDIDIDIRAYTKHKLAKFTTTLISILVCERSTQNRQ